MTQSEVRVDDLIVENLTAARTTVADVLNLTSIEELSQWNTVVSAMRGLPVDAMSQIGGPLIEKIFESFELDPKKAEDRAKLLSMQDIIALSLQDCMQLLVQNMQRQNQSARALRAGEGSLLRG